jgi:hypothetical protein
VKSEGAVSRVLCSQRFSCYYSSPYSLWSLRSHELPVVDPGSNPGRRIRFTTLLSHDYGRRVLVPASSIVLHCENKRLDVVKFILKLCSLKGLEGTM